MQLTNVVFQARSHLEPNELLKGEADETIPTVKRALKILYAFRQAYFEHEAKIASYFPAHKEPVLWNFPPQMIFARFDKFVELLETVEVGVSLGRI
jgi:hypothetical protein